VEQAQILAHERDRLAERRLRSGCLLEGSQIARVELRSCAEGVCGTCETRVIEGIPDHRDLFLSKEEQAANTTMMICCSGSKTPTLVLDL